MKRRALAIAVLLAAPAFAQAQEANPGVAGIKGAWSIQSGYFTRAAEQVSEADYAYKPVATVRSFGELVGHVAGAQNMFCAAVLGEPMKPEDDVEKTAKTKAALVAALKASNEYCNRAHAITDASAAGMVKFFGQDHSKMWVLALNASHVGEHYGNAVTYLRMKGMVPPSSQPRSGQ
jgi:uncharacterized damage-inducible protein DinB